MLNKSDFIGVDNSPDITKTLAQLDESLIGIILSLFGIVGNIITILVLRSPSMRKTSTNIYLTALSCSNIIFLLICILNSFMSSLLRHLSRIKHQSIYVLVSLIDCKAFNPTYYAILLSIVYLTIAVSIDRLIFIKFSLEAKQIITRRITLTTTLSIYLFCIIYSIPFWLETRYDFKLRQCDFPSTAWKIRKFTERYIHFPVDTVIPLIILACIHITIIKNLIAKKRRKKNLRVKTNRSKQGDNYIILMLVTLMIIFALCRLPYAIFVIWTAISPNNPKIYFICVALNALHPFLMTANASTNFLIQCFFGEKFRQILIEFILHIIPNHNRQRNLKIQLVEKQKQQNLRVPEQKQLLISAENSSTTNDLKRSNDLKTTSNENLTKTIPINQQELSSLMTNSEKISVINEYIPFKSNQNYSLHICTNGKRIC